MNPQVPSPNPATPARVPASTSHSTRWTDTLHALLAPGQCAQLPTLRASFPDPGELARELVRRDWVTSFQIDALRRGCGADLVLGPYVLLQAIGAGGTGRVFKARHQKMNRIVALKVVGPEAAADPVLVRRFYREIEAASRLTHPNIVHAYDGGSIGGLLVLVMEYVAGTDLSTLVRDAGPLPVEVACDYIAQAAQGLQYAHEQGLVHRDIKPANLLVSGAADASGLAAGRGTVKVADFGLARLRLTAEGHAAALSADGTVVFGTADYMAPEQALDFRSADTRADVYSLGCTLFFLLTGRAPFAEGNYAQRLLRHQSAAPPSLRALRGEVPASLEALVQRMLAKRPEDRFQDPGQVASALGRSKPLGKYSEADPPGSHATAVAADTFVEPEPRPAARRDAAPNSVSTEAAGGGAVWRNRDEKPTSNLTRSLPAAAVLLLIGVTAFGLFGVFGRLIVPRLEVGAASNRETSEWSGSREPRPAEPAKITTVVYLIDLVEFEVKSGPWKLGKGITGVPTPITVDKQASPKGLGTHPPNNGFFSVKYKLDKGFHYFESSAAIADSSAGSRTPLTFQVLGDGKVLWSSPSIQHPHVKQDCKVNVVGVKVLELKVVCEGSNFGAHAVWIEPQLGKEMTPAR